MRAKELLAEGVVGTVLSARAIFNGTFSDGDDGTLLHGDVTSSCKCSRSLCVFFRSLKDAAAQFWSRAPAR